MSGKSTLTNLLISCGIMCCTYNHLNGQQNPIWAEQAEEILNRDDRPGYVEAQIEEHQELLLYPVNLNSSTRSQLEACGLFSSYQVTMIIRYRETFGDLLSIYELASLKGFRVQRLKEITPFLTVSNVPRQRQKRTTGNRILLFAGRSFTNESDNKLYPGSPWKNSLRIKTGLGTGVSMGIAYEKDPGEKSHSGYRPEHLSGYLECRGLRIVQQLIMGSYRMQNGMGLLQGSGLMHTTRTALSRPLILSSLKPYAGSSEWGHHQGVSCILNIFSLRITPWISMKYTDLSLRDLELKGEKIDWVNYLRETGLHRTATELAGRNLAYLGSAGIQVVADIGELTLGAQFSSEMAGLTDRGKDSLQWFKGPTLHHTSSIHWKWRLPKLEVYGEFAPGKNASSAFLGGYRFFINDFLSGVVQLHWYGRAHRETFASAYSSGSHIMNERGILILIHAEPFRGLRADLALEQFNYPAPRTFVRVPSSGFRYNLTLQNGSQSKLRWSFGLVQIIRQQTPNQELPGIRDLTLNEVGRIDGKVIYQAQSWLTWQSRIVLSFTPGASSGSGQAALQQVTIRVKKSFRCTAQLVLFHIPRWDNRIYLYEPGLYQQFSFPVYNGTGNRLSMLISLKAGRRISIEGKGTIVNNDEGKKWEMGIQLRMSL